MTAVFIASPSPDLDLISFAICLFALATWASLAAVKFSYRTIRRVATALLLALVLAVAVPLVETQDVYWAPQCDGIWYYVNWLMCSEFLNWGN